MASTNSIGGTSTTVRPHQQTSTTPETPAQKPVASHEPVGHSAQDVLERPDVERQLKLVAAILRRDEAKERLETAAAMAGADGVINPEEYEQLEAMMKAYVDAYMEAFMLKHPGWGRAAPGISASKKKATFELVAQLIRDAAPEKEGKYAEQTFYAQIVVHNVEMLKDESVAPHNVEELAALGREWVDTIMPFFHPPISIEVIRPRPPLLGPVSPKPPGAHQHGVSLRRK